MTCSRVRTMALLIALAAAMVGLACEQQVADPGCTKNERCGGVDVEVSEPPRLFVDPPFGIGFDCVSVGCDTTRTFRVENRGGGEAVVTLIRLSVESSTDFSIALKDADGEAIAAPSPEEGIWLSEDEGVLVEVRYQPSDAEADQGKLWIDWYDGKTPYEDAVVKRVEMPIHARVLGDPVAELLTPTLNFGFVPVGESRTVEIEVMNATDGSAVLALSSPELAPGSAFAFTLEGTEQTIYVNPGETARIPVTLSPASVDWFSGLVYISTNDGARPQLAVSLLGTAIRDPWLEIEEPEDWRVDFGDVRIGESRTRQVTLRNLGGQPLQVTATLPYGEELGFTTPIPLDSPLPAIPPLGHVRFDVIVSPTQGGFLRGELRLYSNDPTLPETWVDLFAYGVAPDAVIDPPSLDFGDIVQSWQSPAQTVRIGNGGTGEMTVTGIEFEVGSSSQVRLVEMPQLPVKIGPDDDPLELSLYVDAQTLGPANATLLVHTDSIETPTRSVAIRANVVTCEEGCPVANGTPSCGTGRCEIGSCFQRYHDADQSFSTGCECGEDQTPQGMQDVGDFCSSGANVGPLGDNCGSGNRNWVTRTGTLHTEGDEDLYYFFADDGGAWNCDTFGDSFHLRVQLSAPPGVEFCVRRVDGTECGGENQRTCGLTSWSNGGSYGSDDDSTVTVWVRRTPGSAPMCGAYSISFKAN